MWRGTVSSAGRRRPRSPCRSRPRSPTRTRAGSSTAISTPGNVLIESASGRVVVSDFGLARIARSSTSVTTQGMLLGTPEYWSPEQARGADSETATDMYALGCLLFWLLVGADTVRG